MLEHLEGFIGPAAAVSTSIFWTATSILFTAAGRRIGPTVVNGTRIWMAIVFLAVTHRLMFGVWIPDVSAGQAGFLALSGVVGLSIGDQALFVSFVCIGPRLAMLIMATSPIWAVLFGWVVLGESLPGIAWVGITLTIGGVAWVVLEREDKGAEVKNPRRLVGVILAFVGAACQAGGLLLSKQGMGHGWLPASEHLDPQAATFVRMVFAGLGVLPIVAIHRILSHRKNKNALGAEPRPFKPTGFLFCAGGAIAGPFLGVWMSLVASDLCPLGIAQTLCSLTPIFILPYAIFVDRERISPRAIIGALLAVGGSALLFCTPR